MKKILLLIAIALLLTACQVQAPDNIQTISGIVSGIDSEYIYIDTEDGNGWVLEITDDNNEEIIFTLDDVEVGAKVKITFDTLGNDDIYDDEIISIEVIHAE